MEKFANSAVENQFTFTRLAKRFLVACGKLENHRWFLLMSLICIWRLDYSKRSRG
nr:MAG TPA: hypothetical protein [Caudoviricetes sp.]